jgi:RNA ligase (TIGR02306 family)
MTRQLATIATIDRILPHPNADSLELATVRGWQICVKKGEFFEKPLGCTPGLCVYVEIDSVLPERPEFEFMRDRKFRVKTIRLRGELSQGICFPLSILPYDTWKPDIDVTEILGIKLYEPPIPACLGGTVEGNFPAYLRKTDCERIQNYRWLLDKYSHLEWVAT